MLTLPVHDTSGFKSILQISSWKTKYVAFNVSPLRASCDCERLRHSPTGRVKHNAARPINRIPIELLCDMFLKFVEDDREFPDYSPSMGPLVSLHTRADPTILGQVCSWWRNVALATPALWANILLLEPARTQISRTRLWLDRAGDSLLSIAIHDTREGGFSPASFNEILMDLGTRRPLWRKVHLVLPNVALERLVATITKPTADFRNLESASLSIIYQTCPQPSHEASIDAIWKAFHSSPVLHEVDWRGAYYSELPTHAPLARLTHLNLHSEFSVPSLSDILVSCPRLRVLLVFRLSQSVPSKTSQLEPILLESLHTLTLEASVETGPLFERLTLPSLRSLDIHHMYLNEDLSNNFVPFQEFLARSNCVLETFKFYDENLDEDHLLDYISSPYLRNVTVLDLHVPISNKIITSFARQTDDGFHEIMPFLQRMSLTIYSSDDGLLAQMASSRWANLDSSNIYKSLQKLVLDKDGDYGIEDRLGLTSLFHAGLQGLEC